MTRKETIRLTHEQRQKAASHRAVEKREYFLNPPPAGLSAEATGRFFNTRYRLLSDLPLAERRWEIRDHGIPSDWEFAPNGCPLGMFPPHKWAEEQEALQAALKSSSPESLVLW